MTSPENPAMAEAKLAGPRAAHGCLHNRSALSVSHLCTARSHQDAAAPLCRGRVRVFCLVDRSPDGRDLCGRMNDSQQGRKRIRKRRLGAPGWAERERPARANTFSVRVVGRFTSPSMIDYRRQTTPWTYEVISCRFAVTNQTGEKENEQALANGCRGRENRDIGGRLRGEHTNLALASLTLIRGRARSSLSR